MTIDEWEEKKVYHKQLGGSCIITISGRTNLFGIKV